VPIYEYQCKKCQHVFELLQRFSDPQVTQCPRCGGEVQQIISPPAVQFKGSGWYVTDYARKAAGNGSKKSETATESKPATESKATGESKPRTTTEKK
jgi:putative FmdB family regulatory protein